MFMDHLFLPFMRVNGQPQGLHLNDVKVYGP